MKQKLLMLGVAVSALTTSLPVAAHSVWLLPNVFSVSSTKPTWISVDASASEALFVADVAMGVEGVRITAPQGQAITPSNVLKGQRRAVFDLPLAEPGTYKVENRQPLRYLSRYLAADGKTEKRLFASKPEALQKLPAGARLLQSSALQIISQFYVTRQQSSEQVLTPTGQGVELILLTHPDALAVGEPFRLRLTRDGQPVADAKVEWDAEGAEHHDDAEASALRSDAQGEIRVMPRKAGRHLLRVETALPRATALADNDTTLFFLTVDVAAR